MELPSLKPVYKTLLKIFLVYLGMAQQFWGFLEFSYSLTWPKRLTSATERFAQLTLGFTSCSSAHFSYCRRDFAYSYIV